MTRTTRFVSVPRSIAACSIAFVGVLCAGCASEHESPRAASDGRPAATGTTSTVAQPSALPPAEIVARNAPAAQAAPTPSVVAMGGTASAEAPRAMHARGGEGASGAFATGARAAGGTAAIGHRSARTSAGDSERSLREIDGDDGHAAEPRQENVANLLTAAAVGDNDRRGNYLEFLSRHVEEQNQLALDMSRRVRFRVVDSRNRNVGDARIELFANGGAEQVGRGRSHLDGGWDWFPSLRRGGQGVEGPVTVRVHAGDVEASADFVLPATGDLRDTVTVHLPGEIDTSVRVLDLGFVIDVTGSMGDELRYVNREVGHIVERIEAAVPNTRVRVGAVFYRDRTDETNVQRIPFTTDTQSFARDMQRVVAMGGGDYPEDMNAGLDAAMNQLAWSDGNAADRVMVLIADAPPQPYGDEQFTWHEAIDTASQRGIRVVPVAASGADRTVEYLFRAMGAATSTPYVYLTDDSGVGAPHLAADTDRVSVERFADLLTRLVVSDLQGAGMHEPGAQG